MGDNPRSLLIKALGDTVSFIVMLAFLPAVLVWHFCTAVLMGLLVLVFGSPEPNGYDNPLVRGIGYIAVVLPAVAGLAVALGEVVLIVGVIFAALSK